MIRNKLIDYGVVYTPKDLAEFMAKIVHGICDRDGIEVSTVLDPACGEGRLLLEYNKINKHANYIGIDVDQNVIERNILEADANFVYINNDAISPLRVRRNTANYWKEKLGKVSVVLANPPWSGEKVYDNNELQKRGFILAEGQYDSYVLFLELAIKLLDKKGIMAFIIPDSLFSTQNTKIRKMLCDCMHIEVIARLGEKLFPGINRATTIIVCTKDEQNNKKTRCFRLNTEDRKQYLNGQNNLYKLFESKSYYISQRRFSENNEYIFDIDTKENEEELVKKIMSSGMDMNEIFLFGRGVEISKKGTGIQCDHCNKFQGINKKHVTYGKKNCAFCGKEILVTKEKIKKIISDTNNSSGAMIYVGENIQRYYTESCKYILKNIAGINYKDDDIYSGRKILLRKTGLGIKACIDYNETYTSQTVYILKLLEKYKTEPLEYYLALINSRVIYYFYLKRYGENEWKSHPYLTKKIVYSFPLKKYEDNELCNEIANLSKELMDQYDYVKDIAVEQLICQLYGITENEKEIIYKTMNNLPDLGAINVMKVEN